MLGFTLRGVTNPQPPTPPSPPPLALHPYLPPPSRPIHHVVLGCLFYRLPFRSSSVRADIVMY